MLQTGLVGKFHTRLRALRRREDSLRDRGRELQDALEDVVADGRWDNMPRHLVRLPWDETDGTASYAVFRYLGRVGKREYFLDYVESSVEHQVSYDSKLYVAKASSRRPVRVAMVAPKDTTKRLVELILKAVARTTKKKLPTFRIPRGYYPYGYFRNWVTERWGRRKHHTIHRSGILVAPTMAAACRELIAQWTYSEGIDSLYILTSNGYVHLEPMMDGQHVYNFPKEFFERGTLRVIRRHRRKAA